MDAYIWWDQLVKDNFDPVTMNVYADWLEEQCSQEHDKRARAVRKASKYNPVLKINSRTFILWWTYKYDKKKFTVMYSSERSESSKLTTHIFDELYRGRLDPSFDVRYYKSIEDAYRDLIDVLWELQ